jgi:hypothetical protein
MRVGGGSTWGADIISSHRRGNSQPVIGTSGECKALTKMAYAQLVLAGLAEGAPQELSGRQFFLLRQLADLPLDEAAEYAGVSEADLDLFEKGHKGKRPSKKQEVMLLEWYLEIWTQPEE